MSKAKNIQKEETVIDLSAIIAKAESAVIKERGNNLSRAQLYKYTDEELAEIKIDKDVSKKIRNNIRKRVDFFMSAILGKARRKEDVKEVIEEFKLFYAERFLRNDFSITSLREEKSLNENSRLIFNTALEIVKAHL